MREYSVKVADDAQGARLDLLIGAFSGKHNLGFSRTCIQELISKGRVSVNGSIDVKAHYKVKKTDEIKVRPEDKVKTGLKPEDIPLDIIYEDKDLAIINKPVGLVVHPAPGNREHTLVNALLFHFKELSDINPERPGIVHRLDKDTSGVLVIAKNNSSHLKLSGQFADHSIKRKYVALVRGSMEFDENLIEAPIGRHVTKRENMAVDFSDKSRYAKTYYRTLKRFNGHSLLSLEPFTGRTHQLRVHLAFIGHPILGDKKYGKKDEFIFVPTAKGQMPPTGGLAQKFSRLALHAQSLGFVHPSTDKFVEFNSPLPQEFLDATNANTVFL
ncbi:MAG: RluA family pseudouridine synthase [Candidatus Omnitrophota bacterium]